MAQDTDGRLLYLGEQHGVFNGLAADDRIFGKGIGAGGVKMLGKNSGLANLSGTLHYQWFSVVGRLPFHEEIIDFSSKHNLIC